MVDVSGVDPQISIDPTRGVRPEGAPETPRSRPAGQDDRPDDRSSAGAATQSPTGVPETPAPASPPTPDAAGTSQTGTPPATDQIEISPEAAALGASGGPEVGATEFAPESPESTGVAAPTSEGRAFFDSDLDTDLLSSETQPSAAPQTGPSDGTESGPPAPPTIDQSSLGSATATPASTSNTLETGNGPSDPSAALQVGITDEGTPATNQETSSELERAGNDNQSQTEANRTLGQVVDVFA